MENTSIYELTEAPTPYNLTKQIEGQPPYEESLNNIPGYMMYLLNN